MRTNRSNFPFWVNKIHDETMTLLFQAKMYGPSSKMVHNCPDLDPMRRLHISKEAMRVTTRLTHTMAWILSEKAILNHELTRAEQMADYRPLCEEETCIKCYDDVDDFPRGLITLMDDSLNLFLRASRIEDRLRS